MQMNRAIGRRNQTEVAQCDFSFSSGPLCWGGAFRGFFELPFLESWRDGPTVPDRSIAYFKLVSHLYYYQCENYQY
jgi:hypothetical protein